MILTNAIRRDFLGLSFFFLTTKKKHTKRALQLSAWLSLVNCGGTDDFAFLCPSFRGPVDPVFTPSPCRKGGRPEHHRCTRPSAPRPAHAVFKRDSCKPGPAAVSRPSFVSVFLKQSVLPVHYVSSDKCVPLLGRTQSLEAVERVTCWQGCHGNYPLLLNYSFAQSTYNVPSST